MCMYMINGSERAQLKALLNAYLTYGFGCQECGEDNPRLLSFHHIEGRENEYKDQIFRIIRARGKLSEVELLCANCHILADIRDGTNTKGIRIVRAMEEFAIGENTPEFWKEFMEKFYNDKA